MCIVNMLCSPFFFCINKLQPNTPFRRVREDEVEIDPRFSNNAFTAKVSLDWRCYFKAVIFSTVPNPSIPAGTVMAFICLHCSRLKHKTFERYSTGTSPLKHNVCSVHYHYKLISSACIILIPPITCYPCDYLKASVVSASTPSLEVHCRHPSLTVSNMCPVHLV